MAAGTVDSDPCPSSSSCCCCSQSPQLWWEGVPLHEVVELGLPTKEKDVIAGTPPPFAPKIGAATTTGTETETDTWRNQVLSPHNLYDADELEIFRQNIRDVMVWSAAQPKKKKFSSIVVPYMESSPARKEQLDHFLCNLPDALDSVSCDWEIIVVEQTNVALQFNRGLLCNVGFLRSNPETTSVIFHDVDLEPSPELLPLYFEHPYFPIHIAAPWTKYGNPSFCGGILAVSPVHMRLTGGYPTNFWGWGGEDDVFTMRLRKSGFINYNFGRPHRGEIRDMDVSTKKVRGDRPRRNVDVMMDVLQNRNCLADTDVVAAETGGIVVHRFKQNNEYEYEKV